MNKAFDKIRQAWDKDPLQVIVVGALAATAVAKLLDASTSRANSRAWNKEVDRRIMKSYK